MKINWGTRIVFLYSGFVILILTLVFMSFKQDVNLVTENYYEKEKVYNQKYEGMQNLKSLGLEVSLTPNNEGVLLSLPIPNAESDQQTFSASGKYHFFRPSGAGLDIVHEFSQSGPHFLIKKENLQNGKYHVYVEWEHQGTHYYSEQPFYLDQTP